ncbi:hypothetical protein EIN_111540 [Entamoeba invadens IP1]|uniref:Phorbol-ester/DAG-type domain-containing protein n=1 Tax=Entamoeba invadens IP1 TaxID=370355 RepID=A0A0A1TXU0_ENTIV|nr:hypothetical protein EIN_111540 [Entamoeba invadens IP1]ELP86230.1 hypothetical protein EIN_111540 [Entamoeba invadens IP1]|eukprot:XP_004185576.1 hypothetical protein EIN_111540 [Entamoeba invadens IP1]
MLEKHILRSKYSLCNLYPNAHSFIAESVILGLCGVCSLPMTSLTQTVKCKLCGFSIHKTCVENCFTLCRGTFVEEQKKRKKPLIFRDGSSRAKNSHLLFESSSSGLAFCSSCKNVIAPFTHFFVCNLCGIILDKNCGNDGEYPCKPYSTEEESDTHWFVQGCCREYSTGYSKCFVCKKQTGSSLGVFDFRCVYCGMCLHPECIPKAPHICSNSILSDFIITPRLVEFNKKTLFARYSTTKTPLLFFTNKNTLPDSSYIFFQKLQQTFCSQQLVDISQGFDEPFTFIKNYGNRFICVIFGNKGTLSKVMDAMHTADLTPKYLVLPSPSSVDLSVCSGWGASIDVTKITPLLRQLSNSPPMPFDRWSLSVHSENSKEHFKIVFNEHLVIPFDNSMVLKIDGLTLNISHEKSPKVATIYIMNVGTFNGNRPTYNINKNEKFFGMTDPSPCDGKIEVVEFDQSHFVGQGSVIELILLEQKEFRVDGVGYVIPPSTLVISIFDRVTLLAKNPTL